MIDKWNFLNYTKWMEKLWNSDENSLIFTAKVVNMQFEVYLLLNRAIFQWQRKFVFYFVQCIFWGPFSSESVCFFYYILYYQHNILSEKS